MVFPRKEDPPQQDESEIHKCVEALPPPEQSKQIEENWWIVVVDLKKLNFDAVFCQ